MFHMCLSVFHKCFTTFVLLFHHCFTTIFINQSDSNTILFIFIKVYECLTFLSVVMLVYLLTFISLPLGATMLTDKSHKILLGSVYYKVNLTFFVEVLFTLFDLVYFSNLAPFTNLIPPPPPPSGGASDIVVLI